METAPKNTINIHGSSIVPMASQGDTIMLAWPSSINYVWPREPGDENTKTIREGLSIDQQSAGCLWPRGGQFNFSPGRTDRMTEWVYGNSSDNYLASRLRFRGKFMARQQLCLIERARRRKTKCCWHCGDNSKLWFRPWEIFRRLTRIAGRRRGRETEKRNKHRAWCQSIKRLNTPDCRCRWKSRQLLSTKKKNERASESVSVVIVSA